MILTCPSCQQKYMVTNRSIGPAGRMVRCDNCQHEWFESSPVDENNVPITPSYSQTSDFNQPAPFDQPLGNSPLDNPSDQSDFGIAPAAQSNADFSDPFADDFNRPKAEDANLNFDQFTNNPPDSELANSFRETPPVGAPASDPDDYNFDSPEWHNETAAASSPNFDAPNSRDIPSSPPNSQTNSQPADFDAPELAAISSDNAAANSNPSSVKNFIGKMSLTKSSTEIEFESMIKELDEEMVGLGDLPDIDQLTSFHPTPKGKKNNFSFNKKKKSKTSKQKTGNLTVVAIVSSALFLIFSGLFFGRGMIVDMIPPLGKVYRMAGINLPVKNIGLDFQAVHFEKNPTDSSIMVMGTVLNVSNLPKTIPLLEASARDGQGEVIKTWYLNLSLPILLPGDNTEFKSPIDNIPPATSELIVNFLTH